MESILVPCAVLGKGLRGRVNGAADLAGEAGKIEQRKSVSHQPEARFARVALRGPVFA
jgi:hypothetical protein